MSASPTTTVGHAEVGGALCGCIAALVCTSLATSVIAAKVGGTLCGFNTAFVDTPTAPTVSFTEAAIMCAPLTARWVLA